MEGNCAPRTLNASPEAKALGSGDASNNLFGESSTPRRQW